MRAEWTFKRSGAETPETPNLEDVERQSENQWEDSEEGGQQKETCMKMKKGRDDGTRVPIREQAGRSGAIGRETE
jgi:hypothetical protein